MGWLWEKLGLVLGERTGEVLDECWDGFGSHLQWEKYGSSRVGVKYST